ncbi:hypothetical protein SAMN02983003_0474 [Devosia enhydra]|uniref:LexA-binding, inner membrane-associated hydrolase n=1 Tax=Devosia enhydra TaxID=665118 RepID=A0A1K2HT97_9HYPH|nr:hypothetical protein [Devosia enhydra]SFZ81392.1 hypothetical protein SAMN02983003_0474 [Devosia enhydra]
MITPTHMLVAGVLVARPADRPWQQAAAWFGGFFPDMSVFLMVILVRLRVVEAPNLWRAPDGLYWQEPWQAISAISNSIPMWAALTVAGAFAARRLAGRWQPLAHGLMLFALGALLHVLLDLPVHADDAHIHFWPFSDWRFHSPISYYQRAFHGELVGMIEAGLAVGLAALIIWRFRAWPVRLLAVALLVPHVASYGFLF